MEERNFDDAAPRRSLLAELREIARELAASRELLRELTLRDLRIRYKQATMGIAWAVLMPLVVALSGAIVRLAIARLSHAPVDGAAIAGVMVKSLGWAFFAGALAFGTDSLTINLPLITKVYFAREVLPLAAVLTQGVDTLVAGAVTAVILAFLHVPLTAQLLWLLLVIPVLVLLTLAATLLFAGLNVLFRDARHLVRLVLGFGIFFTPVFVDADALGPRATRLVMLNPLAPTLEALRLAVVDGHDLLAPLAGAGGAPLWEPWYLAWATAWALGGVVAAALLFHRAEPLFAEYV